MFNKYLLVKLKEHMVIWKLQAKDNKELFKLEIGKTNCQGQCKNEKQPKRQIGVSQNINIQN